MPRQHKTDEEKQSCNVLFRVTQAEYDDLKRRAAAEGRTISSYLRWVLILRPEAPGAGTGTEG
jgi:hypothetical protein